MIGLLQEVYQLGWQCFRISGTFTSDFHTLYNPTYDSMPIHTMIRVLINQLATFFEKNENCLVLLKQINHFSGIKLATKLIISLLAKSNNLKVQQKPVVHYFNNKVQYHHFKQQQSRLLISSHAGTSEVGWLFQAAFFYRQKRYHIVLELILHILSRTVKADASFSYITEIPADMDVTELKYKCDIPSVMGIMSCVFDVLMVFESGSSLIPDELEIEVTHNIGFCGCNYNDPFLEVFVQLPFRRFYVVHRVIGISRRECRNLVQT
ncbi:unnamed protein product [Mytilus edulis]|uniref:Uncharacterized protein n=1 Tax=Mytilus edulis TaxID=6550 RepID=A0A8S3V4A9_MYTED|nr:unnamed protein product [Mytilus edulis]